MKKLLVLGAGIYQVPLIKKAREMGIYTVVVSYQGNYPGFSLADKVYYEDTTSIDKMLEIARQEDIDGICTTGTDVALASLGKVVDELGLTGPTYESATFSTNKLNMKKAFIEKGVRTAQFIEVYNIEDAQRAYGCLDKPVMFKAVDSSGSRGIVKVFNKDQIEYAYTVVKQSTKQDYFLVEEFVEGVEFGAQAFVWQGNVQFILPHGDLVFKGDTGVPIGHYVPYELSTEILVDIEYQLRQSIQALNIDNCAINADFILKEDKAFVLEIGARAGATCLPELVSVYYGFDYYEQIIKAALDIGPSFKAEKSQACANELLISDKTGEIVSIENRNSQHSNIVDISFDYSVGNEVRKFRVGPDRIGQIIVKGENPENVLELIIQVKNNIKIQVK